MRGDLQVIDDVDVILEKCPKLLIAIRNLLAYITIQYSTIVIILYYMMVSGSDFSLNTTAVQAVTADVLSETFQHTSPGWCGCSEISGCVYIDIIS